jgi:pSer/pThr/pTyr-binding forkhead associated (FHA) protein
LPLTLLLRSSDISLGTPALTFDGGRVVIGRGAGCDVRLPDPSVSHRHATVRATGSDYSLLDEKSSNGTFLGGVKLVPGTPQLLKHGDLVRVGRVWLEVRIDQTPATRDLAVATRDLALALVSQAMRAQGQPAEINVHVVQGRDTGTVLSLTEEGRVYVVGRDASCDLPLADTDVSRMHVNIVRRGGTVLLRDLGSKNGARLADVRLPPDRGVPWRSGAPLQVGATVMALEEPAATALAELEAAEDEPMTGEDTPPQPERSSSPPGERKGRQPPPSANDLAPVLPARAPAQRDARWNQTDAVVVIVALALLGLSVAGLFWLLHT